MNCVLRYARVYLIIAVSLMMYFMRAVPAFAQSSNPQGINVTPAIEHLTVTPGQQKLTFGSTVTNNTASPITVSVSARDFSALGSNSGSLSFIATQSPDTSHGLASWMYFGQTRVVIVPSRSQWFPVTLMRADRLAPGGHYAAMLFKVETLSNGASGNRITNNEAVSTLVFLTTAGNIIDSIHLDSTDRRPWAIQVPSSVNLVFKNTGNTQTSPRGLVTLIGPAHQEVARGIINVDSGLILPGTSRVISVPLRTERLLSFPGIYTMFVSYRADGTDTTTVYKKSIILVKEPLLVGIFILMLVGIVWFLRRTEPVKKYILSR